METLTSKDTANVLDDLIKINNIRLELGESEQGLPAKIARRLELPEGAILDRKSVV